MYCNNLLQNYPLIVYMVQISLTFKKILLKFFVLSVVLALNGNHLILYKGDNCLSFCTFSFVHCVVYSSAVYGFWLLQTLLAEYVCFQLLIWRKKYHTVGTVLKFNRETAEIDKIDTINTHIHDRLLDAGWVKLVLLL